MKKCLLLFFVLSCYLAEAQQVELTVSGPAGNLYINEIFTGFQSPATVSVPTGLIRVGIGNDDGYFQKTIDLDADAAIDLDNLLPLTERSHRVVIVAPRWTSHGGEMAYLSDSDLIMAEALADRAGAEDVMPGTYGMLDWEVDVFPIVENVTLFRGAASEDVPDMDSFLSQAGLNYLRDEYDVVLLFYSIYMEDGSQVQNSPCCLWGSRGNMWISNLTRDQYANDPGQFMSQGYTHEWLHGIEQTSGIYIVDGLHGAEEHGYTETTHDSHDWRGWYSDFMRGLVPTIPGSAEATDYVGQFPYLKNFGRDMWEDSEPEVITYLTSSVELAGPGIYPNPVNSGGKIQVEIHGDRSLAHYSIYTSEGRLEREGTETQSGIFSINAPEQTGIYFIHFFMTDQTFVKKVVVH